MINTISVPPSRRPPSRTVDLQSAASPRLTRRPRATAQNVNQQATNNNEETTIHAVFIVARQDSRDGCRRGHSVCLDKEPREMARYKCTLGLSDHVSGAHLLCCDL